MKPTKAMLLQALQAQPWPMLRSELERFCKKLSEQEFAELWPARCKEHSEYWRNRFGLDDGFAMLKPRRACIFRLSESGLHSALGKYKLSDAGLQDTLDSICIANAWPYCEKLSDATFAFCEIALPEHDWGQFAIQAKQACSSRKYNSFEQNYRKAKKTGEALLRPHEAFKQYLGE